VIDALKTAGKLHDCFGHKLVMADLHSNWEQCPICGQWDMLVFRGRQVAAMDCFNCRYWKLGPDDMKPDEFKKTETEEIVQKKEMIRPVNILLKHRIIS
jgi:hypothetical protein